MKFKSFFCMVLVLLSCTSMQGMEPKEINEKIESFGGKFYLTWKKKKFEITKKVVKETEKFKDLFENFGVLVEEDDCNKVFDKDGNFIFNMKDIAENINLPNRDKLVDEMAGNDVKNLAKLLGNPEEFNFIGPQDFVVLCTFSLYLNNKKALKACYKDFQDDMTDEKLLGFLEGKGDSLSYVIGKNVIPNDFFMEAWRRYAKGITKPFVLKKPYFKEVKEIIIGIEDSVVGWDEEKKGFYIVSRTRPSLWRRKYSYWQYYYPFSFEDMISIEKDRYEKLKKDALVGSKVDQEIHFGMYFWQINSGSLKLFYSGDKKNPLKIYNIKKVFFPRDKKKPLKIYDIKKVSFSINHPFYTNHRFHMNHPLYRKHSFYKKDDFLTIEKVFVSPKGSKLLVFRKNIMDVSAMGKFGGKVKIITPVIYIELNAFAEGKVLYGNDFAENVVVRGLQLYRQKNKKRFMYNPYSKRMKLLSREMVDQLFKAKLLRKPNREETQKMRQEEKKRYNAKIEELIKIFKGFKAAAEAYYKKFINKDFHEYESLINMIFDLMQEVKKSSLEVDKIIKGIDPEDDIAKSYLIFFSKHKSKLEELMEKHEMFKENVIEALNYSIKQKEAKIKRAEEKIKRAEKFSEGI